MSRIPRPLPPDHPIWQRVDRMLAQADSDAYYAEHPDELDDSDETMTDAERRIAALERQLADALKRIAALEAGHSRERGEL